MEWIKFKFEKPPLSMSVVMLTKNKKKFTGHLKEIEGEISLISDTDYTINDVLGWRKHETLAIGYKTAQLPQKEVYITHTDPNSLNRESIIIGERLTFAIDDI